MAAAGAPDSAILTAQHKDATNVMSTTSGEATPYDTTMTRPTMTEAAGATTLVSNAVTRAEADNPVGQPPTS